MSHSHRKKKKEEQRSTGAEDDICRSGGAEKTKRIIRPTRRKQVEDAEGWTHVVGGGKKVGGGGESWTHAGDFMINGAAYIERTVEEMREDLEFYGRKWEGSEAAKELRGLLRWRCQVKSVVCLGLGSLQSARGEGRRASFTQLAALMMILEAFGGMGADKMQCVFQDPQYTETDKEFLRSLGGIVVDDPLAFEYIKQDTLVYAIHCYGPVYKTVSEGPRPAVLIGTDANNFGRFPLSDQSETLGQHLDDMIKGCEVMNFPQLRHDFSDTRIYWRTKQPFEQGKGAPV
ncbi:hypothetical protein DSL72_008487 [Monilinia vaccinii-corymbosi]|uniref:SRR1-like domain-containing protein n=1 Tax=Monilinia vaccinii-corymbosi TaxID=61207 RepID=A0A8A3PJQ1_9HELO|nr:hypothetical protein DSL72_008487 [Monilinia vaccinii-corymbosi]